MMSMLLLLLPCCAGVGKTGKAPPAGMCHGLRYLRSLSWITIDSRLPVSSMEGWGFGGGGDYGCRARMCVSGGVSSAEGDGKFRRTKCSRAKDGVIGNRSKFFRRQALRRWMSPDRRRQTDLNNSISLDRERIFGETVAVVVCLRELVLHSPR